LFAERYPSAKLPLPALSPLGQSAAVSDFDGDRLPDFAISRLRGGTQNLYSVEVHLTGSPEVTSFETSAQGVLRVSPRDVDTDSDIDLVVATWDGQRVGVWLNNGHGKFSNSQIVIYPSSIWHDPPLIGVLPVVSQDGWACSRDECLIAKPGFVLESVLAFALPLARAPSASRRSIGTNHIRPPPSFHS
jgi:hypothetical protein